RATPGGELRSPTIQTFESRDHRVHAQAPDHPQHHAQERYPVEPATGSRLDCFALGETESSSAEEHLDKGYPSPGRVHDRPAGPPPSRAGPPLLHFMERPGHAS